MHKLLTCRKFWIAVGLCVYIGLFFLVKTNLAASDLGRHVTNGRVIWQSNNVFHINLYSYTNPNFPAPNHHWLFGVISFLLHEVGGFELLTITGAALYIASIACTFYFSYQRAGFYPAAAATLLALPLLTDRSETRPEAFSLFFFTLMYILFAWVIEQKKITHLWLICLAFTTIIALWVNIHIFFVLTGVLGLSAAVHGFSNKLRDYWQWMIALATSLIIGVLLNPLGLKLALYPLEIFNNYGYRVSENQPLWFFLQHYTRAIHWYLVFFLLIFTGLTIIFVRKRFRSHLYYVLVSGFFLLFTVKLIRMENIFAISAIPLLSQSLAQIWPRLYHYIKKSIRNTVGMMVVSTVGFSLVILIGSSGLFFPFKPTFGMGLFPGYNQSITFLQNFPFTGTIFNNFDSGSFLIYALYPSHQVFIDNRAEAYPADFIQNKYLQAQQDETVWREIEQEYNFAAILFFRHEQTNWGQEFLVKRIQDDTWVPVYVDNYLILFLKDNDDNQKLIEQYRLPSEMFSITEN